MSDIRRHFRTVCKFQLEKSESCFAIGSEFQRKSRPPCYDSWYISPKYFILLLKVLLETHYCCLLFPMFWPIIISETEWVQWPHYYVAQTKKGFPGLRRHRRVWTFFFSRQKYYKYPVSFSRSVFAILRMEEHVKAETPSPCPEADRKKKVWTQLKIDVTKKFSLRMKQKN